MTALVAVPRLRAAAGRELAWTDDAGVTVGEARRLEAWASGGWEPGVVDVEVEDEDEDAEPRLALIRSLGGDQEEPGASVPEPGESWDGIAYAGYHQLYIGHAEDELDYPDECVTNLIEPLPNGACIVLTGIHTGGVRYSVQCHESAPAVISDEWEDTATVTVEWRRTPVHVIGWAAESMDDHDLAFRGPGWYSIRCSARGRALEVDLGATTAQETFRLDIWPADGPAAPVDVRLTSRADT